MNEAKAPAARLFVTSDPHGHLAQLEAGLSSAGLVNDHGDWCGGTARLYVLGDLVDRGPDGIGVIDLLMRLEVQAEEAQGQVVVLLGNHEVLALGMHLFGTEDVEIGGRSRNFAVSWMRNGGVGSDPCRERAAPRRQRRIGLDQLFEDLAECRLVRADRCRHLRGGGAGQGQQEQQRKRPCHG